MDIFIEKDVSINDEIDKFRYFVILFLFEWRDVIIIVSVFCIYGFGLFEEYWEMVVLLWFDMEIECNELFRKFVDI